MDQEEIKAEVKTTYGKAVDWVKANPKTTISVAVAVVIVAVLVF